MKALELLSPVQVLHEVHSPLRLKVEIGKKLTLLALTPQAQGNQGWRQRLKHRPWRVLFKGLLFSLHGQLRYRSPAVALLSQLGPSTSITN